MESKQLKTVGTRYRRKDGFDKLTGRAKYPQDISMEGELHGYTVRSTIPHGYFTLDLSKAEGYPGVVKILTAVDVLAANHHGVLFKDHEVFCEKKVRRVGDPLAFIIAKTPKIAEEAGQLVEVTYEELEPVLDPVEGMKEDAPQVHDGKSNIIYHYKCRKGNVEKAFAEAAVVVENTYYSPFVDHAFLQLESGLAWMEDDVVVVMASTQYPHFDRLEVADAIGIPEEKIRIINPSVGGAFGGREDITMQIHLALGTMLTGRPVKVTYTREESFYAHSKRHPMVMKCRSAADAEGNYTAFEAEIIGDTGAYASWAINVLRKAGVHAYGPYAIPNVKVDSIAVYTNNPFCGAMRGFGATQVPIMYEQQADMLARELKMDPFAFRMKNIFRQGSETANGQVLVESVPLDKCLEVIEEAMAKDQQLSLDMKEGEA